MIGLLPSTGRWTKRATSAAVIVFVVQISLATTPQTIHEAWPAGAKGFLARRHFISSYAAITISFFRAVLDRCRSRPGPSHLLLPTARWRTG